jgi:hypothetical protein
MPDYLDYCEDADPYEAKRQADKLEAYWRGLIRRKGGQSIVTVRAEKYSGKRGMVSYRIRYTVQVSRDSQAFKDFAKKLGWL